MQTSSAHYIEEDRGVVRYTIIVTNSYPQVYNSNITLRAAANSGSVLVLKNRDLRKRQYRCIGSGYVECHRRNGYWEHAWDRTRAWYTQLQSVEYARGRRELS